MRHWPASPRCRSSSPRCAAFNFSCGRNHVVTWADQGPKPGCPPWAVIPQEPFDRRQRDASQKADGDTDIRTDNRTMGTSGGYLYKTEQTHGYRAKNLPRYYRAAVCRKRDLNMSARPLRYRHGAAASDPQTYIVMFVAPVEQKVLPTITRCG